LLFIKGRGLGKGGGFALSPKISPFKSGRENTGESKRAPLSKIPSPYFLGGVDTIRRVVERRSPSFYFLPPHAKNTSPYHEEGDTGGEVNKTTARILVGGVVEWEIDLARGGVKNGYTGNSRSDTCLH
jgi:hypothetical protein